MLIVVDIFSTMENWGEKLEKQKYNSLQNWLPSVKKKVSQARPFCLFSFTTKMADDAVKNFCPPSKKAKYSDDAASPGSSDVPEESTGGAAFNGVPHEPVESKPGSNGISSNVDEEEGERQIMNGGDRVS